MTTEPNRQPEGIPTGGQYAAKVKSDDVPGLSIIGEPGAGKTLSTLLEERDLVRERRERLDDQKAELDHQASRYAARGLAGTILAQYPTAATLRISENEDAAGQYRLDSITAADGTILESADDALDWTEKEASNGTYLYEFADDLEFDSDRWADGIATVNQGNKYDFKSVDIDLRTAAEASVPDEVTDITTRPLTEAEQEILVETARAGIREMEDQLTERSGDYSPSEVKALEERLAAAWQILS